MIRVNLIKPEPAVQMPEPSGVPWILATLIAIVVLGGIAFMHEERHSEYREVWRLVEEERGSLRELVADQTRLESLQAKRDLAMETQARFDGLASRRADLGAMVNDLHAMTDRALARRDANRLTRRGWDLSWDPSALQLAGARELDGRLIITGSASSADDIVEYQTRLASSPHLRDLRVENFTAIEGSRGRDTRFGFRASARLVSPGVSP